MCEVVFRGKLPSPDTVDKIVREALEKAVEKDPSRDILATAFLGDETLNSNQYSGNARKLQTFSLQLLSRTLDGVLNREFQQRQLLVIPLRVTKVCILVINKKRWDLTILM